MRYAPAVTHGELAYSSAQVVSSSSTLLRNTHPPHLSPLQICRKTQPILNFQSRFTFTHEELFFDQVLWPETLNSHNPDLHSHTHEESVFLPSCKFQQLLYAPLYHYIFVNTFCLLVHAVITVAGPPYSGLGASAPGPRPRGWIIPIRRAPSDSEGSLRLGGDHFNKEGYLRLGGLTPTRRAHSDSEGPGITPT